MAFSYNKRWKLLIDKNMNKTARSSIRVPLYYLQAPTLCMY